MLKSGVFAPITLTSSKICDIIKYLRPTIMVIGAEALKKIKEAYRACSSFPSYAP